MNKKLSALILSSFIAALWTGPAIAKEWKSLNGNKKRNLTVYNYLNSDLSAYWLDYQGNEKFATAIKPGKGYTFNTFATHPFVFKLNGREYSRYQVDERQNQIVSPGLGGIGVPAPGKGFVQFQPIEHQADFKLTSPSQSGSIRIVIKPKLVLGSDYGRYLHIDLDGSSVVAARYPNKMTWDTQQRRGWFLEKVTTKIVPHRNHMVHFKSANFSTDESGQVSSSSSQTISGSISGGADQDGASVGAELGFSRTVGTTYTRDLKGFSARVPQTIRLDGKDAAITNYDLTGIVTRNDGGLKGYSEPKSMVDFDGLTDFAGGFTGVFTGKAFEKFHLHNPPEKAKSGLPIVSQAIFKTAQPGYDGLAHFTVEVKAVFKKMWVSGKTKVDGKYHWRSTSFTALKNFGVDMSFNNMSPPNVKW